MIFDAHTDLLNDITERRLTGETRVFQRKHKARLAAGAIEGAILVLWPEPQFSEAPWQRILTIMQAAREETLESRDLRIVTSHEEILKARAEGAFYAVLGLEGMAGLESHPERLEELHAFGVRHAMLTWNESNGLASGAASGVAGGLSAAGRKAVRRIQDLGMILDVSHLNAAGFWDAASLATRPFMASHSNASALCGVPRNLSDDQLRQVRDVNGVVGINAYRRFIDPDPRRQTVRRLAEHAAHMIDVMGIDHVCCGFDFCEFLAMGEVESDINALGMKDASETASLFQVFEEMGMTAAEQAKIARLNLDRVVKDSIG